MDERKNSFDSLGASFTRAANFSPTPVRGIVESVDTFESRGKRVYLLHVANGGQRDAFWLLHDNNDSDFRAPRRGHMVKGVVDANGKGVEFLGETHQPLFSFVNRSKDSEHVSSAWYRTQAANQEQPLTYDARKRLHNQLGLRLNEP